MKKPKTIRPTICVNIKDFFFLFQLFVIQLYVMSYFLYFAIFSASIFDSLLHKFFSNDNAVHFEIVEITLEFVNEPVQINMLIAMHDSIAKSDNRRYLQYKVFRENTGFSE